MESAHIWANTFTRIRWCGIVVTRASSLALMNMRGRLRLSPITLACVRVFAGRKRPSSWHAGPCALRPCGLVGCIPRGDDPCCPKRLPRAACCRCVRRFRAHARDALILGCRIIHAGRSVSNGGRRARSRRGLGGNAARAEQRPGWDGFYPNFLVPVGFVFSPVRSIKNVISRLIPRR